jgi:hypothetical protein
MPCAAKVPVSQGFLPRVWLRARRCFGLRNEVWTAPLEEKRRLTTCPPELNYWLAHARDRCILIGNRGALVAGSSVLGKLGHLRVPGYSTATLRQFGTQLGILPDGMPEPSAKRAKAEPGSTQAAR